ncbi:H/ACA ribonucleoprotein complex subunit GAR1 [Methanococcoides burtonii]|nr:Gar1/Naf1 family protein [Methanococcoides burtonii]
MKRLGTVVQTVAHNGLLVRGENIGPDTPLNNLPRINLFVVDKSVRRIGKVNGVIGSVNSPYISIKVMGDISPSDLRKYLNEKVYVK